ncbi:MAG: RNA polymerase factor sigma-54 [Proteobacteria bacterium]|nr:RNA polymerase factor sigma-54 [Pseudomonadota bacterium]MBU1714380.1 RNA polymerase factor sigma-54 [Pseudomonadota bacterium]
MALELRQQLKLSQQLVMTPQLQQAIKLLQLSRLELAATVQQEIEQNPLLEEISLSLDGEDDSSFTADSLETLPEPPSFEEIIPAVKIEETDFSLKEIDWQDYANEYESLPSFKSGSDSEELPSRLDILVKKPNLQTHLQWQLGFADLTTEEEEVGAYVIGNLNRDGFLEVDLEAIAQETGCSEDTAQAMVRLIQEMDPAGIAARSVRESLLLQLERLELADSLSSVIIRDHIHLLENKNYAAIIKAVSRPKEEVQAAIKVIVSLDPYPGRAFSDEEPQYIVPDVYVYKMDDEYVILLNDEGLPRLKVSAFYKDALKKDSSASDATKDYIQDKMKSAAWLIKSIQQRQRTIYRVVESIVKFQRDFFERGVAHLKPLILRDVAEDIEMHESTISRVTSNKYLHSPQGTYELKYFFNSSIEREDGGDAMSSATIKNRLKQIVQAEDPRKPLSDNAIADIFKKENIKLARRTVAKYREQLNILPSKFRKEPNY